MFAAKSTQSFAWILLEELSNFIHGQRMVQGELPFRVIFILANNSLKELSRPLKHTEALFLENYKDVSLVELLILNVRCNY